MFKIETKNIKCHIIYLCPFKCLAFLLFSRICLYHFLSCYWTIFVIEKLERGGGQEVTCNCPSLIVNKNVGKRQRSMFCSQKASFFLGPNLKLLSILQSFKFTKLPLPYVGTFLFLKQWCCYCSVYKIAVQSPALIVMF